MIRKSIHWGFSFAACILSVSCSPTGLPTGSPSLSKTRAAPGEYLIIEHDGIEAGLPAMVIFTAPDGTRIEVPTYDVANGSLGVAVPPVYNPSTASIGAGRFTVTIEDLEGQSTLDVDDLPTISGLEPGAMLKIVLETAIAEHQRTIANFEIMAEQGGPDGPAVDTASATSEIARLQAILDELNATGQLVVELEGIGTATVTSELLALGDRILVSTFTAPNAAAASKREVNHRDIAECIAISVPEGFDRAACLREVVADVGTAVLPAVETAGRVATGIGVVVTIVGATATLVAATPVGAVLAAGTTANIALTGLYVSIAGGTISVVSATMQGKNTDAFLQDSGEDFNLGLEILSQMLRVAVSSAATGFEAFENELSALITWIDRGITGADAFAGFSCSSGESQKGILPRAVSVAFCSFARPGLCDNTCSTAFDGVCDDGGPGAPRSGCALGTDCLDCGGREETASDGQQICTDVCLFPLDGECDDGGPGSDTSFCDYGTDCTDCGGRDPIDEPTGDEEAACCYTSGCLMQTFDACAFSGGDYLGQGTVCTEDSCPSAEPAVEYVIWYTANVSCWSAPLMYITDRAGFEREEIASSYPGGGIDPMYPLEKAELQGGFASVEEAREWICPQFVSRFSHAWCSSYYQTANCNWQPGGLGCDLSALPFTDTLPDGSTCP